MTMINFCVITPDRGDRPQFLEHCRYQMNRQTVKLDLHLVIGQEDHKPIPGVVDIIPRIKKGIEMRSLWDKIKDPFEIEKNRRECFEALDELNRTIERLNRNLK